jgi:hypothetical protein
MSEFEKGLYKVKGVLLKDDSTIVHGYYNSRDNTDFIDNYEINPYTLCGNTGIKVKNEYLYENDLIEYKTGLTEWQMGFIEWDSFKNSYAIRTSLNFSSKKYIHGLEIKIIGNVTLNYSDMDIMQKYSDKEEANYKPEPQIECRSTQHLNKKSKMFLPR